MKKLIWLLAFVFNLAFATQTVAVLPSDGTLSDDENELLTDKMREAALKVLPLSDFTLLKQDVVIKRLGGMESYMKECSETSCIVSLGKKAQVDYVAQCRIGKLGNNLRITVELYEVSTGGLLGMFSDVAESFSSLPPLMEKNIPDVFKNITVQRRETAAPPPPPPPPPTPPPPPPPAKDERTAGKTGELEKAIDVELGYREPEKKIDPQVEVKKEGSKSFWLALALDIAGAGLLSYGFAMNEEAVSRHKNYVNHDYLDSRTTSKSEFDRAESAAWEKVDNAKTKRNISYILGSIVLTTGIGVHIWF